MVGGFNTNIRYQGRTFHVQTEDSGPNIAKIVTLLYEGGSILYSRKTSYATDEAPNLTAHVRELMERQHKEMVEALKSGVLDHEIGGDSTADAIVEVLPPVEDAEPPASRPAPTPSSAPRARPASARTASAAARPARFGEGVVGERSLDEVVLAHFGAT